LGHGEKNSWRAYDFRIASDSCKRRLDCISRKIHLREIADVKVARWARVRVAATVGLERRLFRIAVAMIGAMRSGSPASCVRWWFHQGALWSDIPVQRCTVHKHRNLLAHAPDRLHDELSADYKDMIYVGTKQEIETKRKAFIRKWRLKCKAVADSLKRATSRSPSRASPRANGNRSERRMRSSDCTKSSSGGSRPRPCCLPRKLPN
jgi:Transposase, Mutator family